MTSPDHWLPATHSPDKQVIEILNTVQRVTGTSPSRTDETPQ